MSDIETTWFAIRFNPQDLTVNTGDYTFVTYACRAPAFAREYIRVLIVVGPATIRSTGYNTHHKDMGPDAATHVPFATCFGTFFPPHLNNHHFGV